MIVYKYRGGSKRDIISLSKNQFYSASVDSLNDILEAKIKINNKEFDLFDLVVKNKIKSMTTSFSEILNKFIKEAEKFGIYSLSKNYSNELLWAYYSNSHKGFCIEYDFDILKQYQLNTEFNCNVQYKKNIPIINFDDVPSNEQLIQKLLATKSITWKHEEEYRVITGTIGLFNYYNRALKSIYFGYKIEKKIMKLIMRILRGRGIKYFKMYPKKDLYQLERQEIENIYKNYKKQINKNEFTPIYDDKIEPYRDLIEKAITIVEQEPMCEKVIDAYISSSKGTNKNPVFFITYKDKIRKLPAINYFISKTEIDNVII